jgi:hypothetical protein
MKKENNYTPSNQIQYKYNTVQSPTVGMYYHLSWAYKGARFCLTKIIDDTYGEVYTGKTKNKTLKIKLSDLRELRQK